MTVSIDLGLGHTVEPVAWSPDRELNPQYDAIPDVEVVGYRVPHLRPDNGEPCAGFVYLDLPEVRAIPGVKGPFWQVRSLDPLHLEPSLLCRRCGDHGFIRDGKWVTA